MKKIALCLSGQPRNLSESYGYLKHHLIEPNNITDIFIHMWWRPEWSEGKEFVNDSVRPNVHFKKEYYDDVTRLYNPKAILIENDEIYKDFVQKEFVEDESYISPERARIHNRYPQTLSVFKANELKNKYAEEHGIEYDMVVRSRLDNCPLKVIIVSDLDVSRDVIYMPNVGKGGKREDLKEVVPFHANDCFAVSNKKCMDIYCDLVHNLKEIAKRDPTTASEGTIGNHLAHNNLLVKFHWLDREDIDIYRNINPTADLFERLNVPVKGPKLGIRNTPKL